MMTEKILLCSIFIVGTVFANDHTNELTYSLEKILKFCLANDHILDLNLLFGVAIVAGQLKVTEKYVADNQLRDEIRTVSRLANSIFEKGFLLKANQNSPYDETQKKLLSPEMWNVDNTPKFLNKSLVSCSSGQESANKHWQSDTRFRDTYDICLKHLLDSCYIPVECSDSILSYRGGGYTITHQILYLQITKRLLELNLCTFPGFVNFDYLMNEKCSLVYEDMKVVEPKSYYNDTAMDLVFEEVVVCGLENYAEFFETDYLRTALEFPSGMYCKASTNNKDQMQTYTLAHLISVKMAVVAVYLKRLIQEQYYRTLKYEDLLSSIFRKNSEIFMKTGFNDK